MSRNSVAHASSPSSSSTPSRAQGGGDQRRQQLVLAVARAPAASRPRCRRRARCTLALTAIATAMAGVGRGVDVDVTVAAGRRQHRDPRVLEQELLERLAAARDDHVGRLGVGDELARAPRATRRSACTASTGRPASLHGPRGPRRAARRWSAPPGREPRSTQALPDLTHERGRVDGDVGPGLVDDQDDAQRDAQLGRSRMPLVSSNRRSTWCRPGRAAPSTSRTAAARPAIAVGRQRQPVDDGRRLAGRGGDVEPRWPPGSRRRRASIAAAIRSSAASLAAGRARPAQRAAAAGGGGEVSSSVIAHNSTRLSRCTTSSDAPCPDQAAQLGRRVGR